MALNVKKGDNVLIIAGKDKGKTGNVLVAMPADNSVVVAGVNIVAKHKKPRSANDKGGIIKKENKIDASNVQIICPVCNKATRVSIKIEGDVKSRICKKCGANLDTSKKESKKATKDTTKKTTTKVDIKEDVKEVKTEAKKPAEKKTTSTKKTTSAPKAEKTETAKKATTTKSTSTKSTASKSTTTTKTTAKKSTTKKVESK